MPVLDQTVSQPLRAQAVHGRVSRKLAAPTARQRTASVTQQHFPANMWQSKYSVGNYPTEAWGMQSRQPRMQVLILPGNPGSACWYRVFMQQLFAAFNGAADVMAVSHVGHDCDDISSGAVWGLDCQVQHKVRLLQELTAPGRPPLVVLAHSIGSFITLQALRQLNRQGRGGSLTNIAKVFLMMPFLATDWRSLEQRVLATAARQHGQQLAAAAGWVQRSPDWVQDRVAELMLPGAEPHAKESLRAALKQPSCMNNWHMAAQEFSVLDGPVDWGLIQQLGSKAAVVYNPQDPWFQQYGAMQEVLPEVEAYAEEGLSHAFCLSTAESRAVAQLVHASVTQGAAAPAVGRVAAGQARPRLRSAPGSA